MVKSYVEKWKQEQKTHSERPEAHIQPGTQTQTQILSDSDSHQDKSSSSQTQTQTKYPPYVPPKGVPQSLAEFFPVYMRPYVWVSILGGSLALLTGQVCVCLCLCLYLRLCV